MSTLPRPCFLLLAIVGLTASCSTYQADFAQAVAAAKIPPNSPYGPWQGRWKSNFNGHEGPLWCIITPNPENPKARDFRYRAGWGRLQFGDYVHTSEVAQPRPYTLVLDDQMALPGGFGTYSIKGTVTNTTFNATFQSDGGDHGTITMRRPQQ